MPIEFKRIYVSESGQSVVVTGIIDDKLTYPPSSGEVCATELAPGEWYINRAIVGPKQQRGLGLGSQLMTRLLAVVSSKPGFVHVNVEPGGYGESPKKQKNFYTKNGFKPVEGEYNLYRWTKEKEAHVEATQEVHDRAPDAG